MRFACATAGVLVIATVSQAAPSPWKESRSTGRVEGIRYVSAAAQMSKRSGTTSTVDRVEDWGESGPSAAQSDLNSPLANKIQKGDLGAPARDEPQQTPPKEDSEASGRVHAYSEPEEEALDQRLTLPLKPSLPASRMTPKKDSGPNGRVHAYSQGDDEEEDNRQRLALPTSPTRGDKDEPADESQTDSDSNGRVHAYSQEEEPKERLSLPLRGPLGIAGGGERDSAAPTTPTKILLQAIAEYRGALLGDGGPGQIAAAPPSAGAEAALTPDHTIVPFPLLKYQTRPVSNTIHQLSNNTLQITPAVRSANNLTTALPNISSLANNSPDNPSLIPQTPSPPGLANISSLSNNSHP
ncbi:uncharacterized protein VP01_61g14 [Puccinia sorghi]|uniref:Uncharacterized protein n=1 Tax=Puccinia sorghi TaxID=27349 RepID=A0A0L6UGQ2_9BASI|nr:uncharacterized protein VP01_61g14 [Puccinia sorghi]